MKIRPREEDLNSAALGTANQNKLQRARQEGGAAQLLSDGDTVSVGLASAINSEFNPATLQAERREKIEKLKELIKAGKYNPSSTDVASALDQEVTFEVAGSGGVASLFNPSEE